MATPCIASRSRPDAEAGSGAGSAPCGAAGACEACSRAGNSRFEIRLDPPELGRIDVRLDVDRDGNVSSRLVIERADTYDLLRRDQSTRAFFYGHRGLRAALPTNKLTIQRAECCAGY